MPSLGIICRLSRRSCVAPLCCVGSNIFILLGLDVRWTHLVSTSLSRRFHVWVGCPSLWQLSVRLNASSCLGPLERGTLGSHPQCRTHLLPHLGVHIHIPRGPLVQLSSTRVAIGGILSCYGFIRHPDPYCRSVGDHFISCSLLLAPGFGSPPPLSTKRATFQAPIFQLSLGHSSFSRGHSQLPRLELPSPLLHLLLFPLNAVPFLCQVIICLALHLIFFCPFSFFSSIVRRRLHCPISSMVCLP